MARDLNPKNSKIVVVLNDKAETATIVVNGEGYVAAYADLRQETSVDLPAHTTIEWDTGRNRSAGVMRGAGKANVLFSDSKIIEPFLEVWKIKQKKRKEEILAKEEAEEKAALEAKEEEKRNEEAAKQRREEKLRITKERQVLTNALDLLLATDHEVIKAAEVLLEREGLLPKGMAAKRDVARTTVGSERKRLGL